MTTSTYKPFSDLTKEEKEEAYQRWVNFSRYDKKIWRKYHCTWKKAVKDKYGINPV